MANQDRTDGRALHKRKNIESVEEQTMQSNGVNEASGKPQPADDTNPGMSIEHVKERMERLRHDVVNHVGDQFDGMMSDIMDELKSINKFEGTSALRLDEKEKLYCDKRKTDRHGALPEKQFLQRNSVLTDLYEIKHFKTIYNIFIVALILMSLHTVIYDLLHTGTTNLGLKLIAQGFAKFPIVIEIWLLMVVSTFGAYVAFNYWAQTHITTSPKSYKRKAWDYSWILLFLVYQISLMILPTKAIIWAELPPISSLVILSEQTRMVMKIHAFVRSNAPIALNYKPHSDNKALAVPEFSKFLYFMFAPTLIYRDSYPRTKKIRWSFALWHFTEVILVMFNMSFIFGRVLLPPFEDFGKHPFDVRTFVMTVYGTWLPSIIIFISGFYCLLHAWMNAAAEVMRFADRLFYKDWWNSTTHATYYPRWNVVVHDWLYTYIYKDIYEHVFPGHRLIATFAVFFVSAIVHEYIMAFTFGFLFPVMLFMFGIVGFPLVFLPRTSKATGNMFLWFSLCTGSAILICMYSMEYFARVNCPQLREGIVDLFIPRSFFCF